MRGMGMDLGRRIGRRIRQLREERGLTQAQFAELTGKAVETISNMERGKTIPGLLTLDQFARHLGVPLEEMVKSDQPEADPHSQNAAIVAVAARRLPDTEMELVAGMIGLLDKQRRKSRRSQH